MSRDVVWLVGSGAMAQAYASVLGSLDVDFTVIGRGETSASAFEEATGHAVRTGGARAAIAESSVPATAIVAVGVDHLADTACALLDAGVKRLLLEKPGGLSSVELSAIADKSPFAEVIIAYNRRHFASTTAARRMISEDGGVTSFAFEVTEWPHATEPRQVDPAVRSRWFLAQSSHVVDLAFHLGGLPVDWRCWNAGSLQWHSESARFAGAGITASGATFGFHGDWEAPGQWGLEVLTRRHRLIFRPLERLQVMSIGALEIVESPIDDRLDRSFKPGVHEETRLFLEGNDQVSCTLMEQISKMPIYERMAGYG